MTVTRAWLAERGYTVVDGKAVPTASIAPPELALLPTFPDPNGCWCIDGEWTRASDQPSDTDDREGKHQEQIRQLFTSKGCRVLCLSQYRPSAIAKGVPDLYVFGEIRGEAFWWETKRPRGGIMSPDQIAFALDCARTHTLYGCGPLSAAYQFAQAIGL